MQFDLSKIVKDSKWFTFKSTDGEQEAEVEITPFLADEEDWIIGDETFTIKGSSRLDKFVKHLKKWKKILDADGKPLPCNKEIKTLFFKYDFCPELVNFVINKAGELRKTWEDSEKN